ncbi:MAG: hypothetical protein U0169_10580 [Polyangiaceae bacterium]
MTFSCWLPRSSPSSASSLPPATRSSSSLPSFFGRTAAIAAALLGVAGLVGCSSAPAEEVSSSTAQATGVVRDGLQDGENGKDLLNKNPDNRPTKPMTYPNVYFQPAVKSGPGSCGYAAIANMLLLWLRRDHEHYLGYTPQWIMEQTGYRASTGMVSWDATDFLNSKERNPEVRAGDWGYMTGAVPWNNTGWNRILDDLRAGRPWAVSMNSCKWGNWSASRAQLRESECMANKFWEVAMSHWVILAGARESPQGREILIMENGNYTWLPHAQFDLRMDTAAFRYATFYPTEGRAATHLVVPENAYASAAGDGTTCVAWREANPTDICGGPCDCAGADKDALAILCDSDPECRAGRAAGPEFGDLRL